MGIAEDSLKFLADYLLCLLGGDAHPLVTYRPLKAVDREFIYKISARNPRDPKTSIFNFFTGVLGPGRCLDGFVRHFSSRYTPSDPKFISLDPQIE